MGVTVFCRTTLNHPTAVPSEQPAATEVEILDGRAEHLPGWPVCGFELMDHVPAVGDWDDEDEIAAVHHPEMEALARQLTGCDHALVSGHIKRSPAEAARHRDLGPIRFVHSDFGARHDEIILGSLRDAFRDDKAVDLARRGLTAELVAGVRRVVVLQFWRNLGPPKMDLPLALCDARTVRVDDARPFTVRDYAGAGGGAFEALAVMAPSEPGRHRWYAFPELHVDETIAFRTYDTELVRAGQTWFTPHTAFRDPDVPLGEPARSSIELRASCLFV